MLLLSFLLPRIKIEGARVPTTLNIDFSDTQWQLTPVIDWIWLKFELIRDVMKVLVTSTNEEDPIKIEGATLNINFSNKGS